MKPTLLVAALTLCLTGPLWAQSDSGSDSSDSSAPPHGDHHGFGPPLTEDERTELKAAHDAAIKANPDLVTEGKKLQEEWKDYDKKMHDAMVAADPKVEAILAKMPHHHHGPPPGGAGGGDGPGGNQ